MTNSLLAEIRKLSIAERIQRVANIWDSIAAEPDSVPLPPEQADEVERRLADAEGNPGVGRSWAEVRARLQNSDRGLGRDRECSRPECGARLPRRV